MKGDELSVFCVKVQAWIQESSLGEPKKQKCDPQQAIVAVLRAKKSPFYHWFLRTTQQKNHLKSEL